MADIADVDSTGQLADVLGLPQHLEDALWKFDSAAAEAVDAPGGLIVAGMGGSAVGGLLAAAVIGPRARRPIVSARDYTLPPTAGPDTLVLCSSYSGGTEETLAAYEEAGERGAPRLVATTGGELAARARRDGVPVIPVATGFQPRAAVGYALVAALEAAALCGAAPSLREEIKAAAELGGELPADWQTPDSPPGRIAEALYRRIPVVYGAGLTAPVAYRWKTQLNENAKAAAFWGELPEMNHNEICGWDDGVALAALFLDDKETHPRTRLRFRLSYGQTGGEIVKAVGETRMERLVSLVLMGDLVSLHLAALRGVDPVEIAALDRLKAELAEQTE